MLRGCISDVRGIIEGSLWRLEVSGVDLGDVQEMSRIVGAPWRPQKSLNKFEIHLRSPACFHVHIGDV